MKELYLKIKRAGSLAIARKPEQVLLFFIFICNVVLVFGSAGVLIAAFPHLSGGSFWRTAYNVFTMILDAGCISELVGGQYSGSPALAVGCIFIILFGTLIFTGAIIGYLSNSISNFITDANNGKRKLTLSDHIVIINWNNRASEIINDLMYSDHKERVVILVSQDREKVELEINNRISDTVEREKATLVKEANELIRKGQLKKSAKRRYIKERYQIKKVSVIVREGEVYSLKQLNDISLSTAKYVIILSKNGSYELCKYQNKEFMEKLQKGNIETVKTLVQVSQIVSDNDSRDNQKVVVEVEDNWTMELVKKIITHKNIKSSLETSEDGGEEKSDKCVIIPVPINKILGQILSQFSVMPELNSVYSELFSNKGSTFYSRDYDEKDEIEYFSEYLRTHDQALPITTMDVGEGKRELFYIATKSEKFDKTCLKAPNEIDVKVNPDFRFGAKHIAILGHNSRYLDILEGFRAFVAEWGSEDDNLIDIMIIDDEEYLRKVNNYDEYRFGEGAKYPFIESVVPAEIYDSETIQKKLTEYIGSHPEDTSVLILSDDYAIEEEIDSMALTYLVYLQDIVYKKSKQEKDFNPHSIDVIVELINPKNYDVVKSYSVDNIIISNRYISRMLVQVGEKESIYEFYKDILTYDTEAEEQGSYVSKELYIKDVANFLDKDTQYPIVASIRDFVAGVYFASPDDNKSMVLGLVESNSKNKLFTESKGNEITINRNDKIILFSPH